MFANGRQNLLQPTRWALRAIHVGRRTPEYAPADRRKARMPFNNGCTSEKQFLLSVHVAPRNGRLGAGKHARIDQAAQRVVHARKHERGMQDSVHGSKIGAEGGRIPFAVAVSH